MLTGIFVPLITPLDTDGDVDTAALARLAHRVLDDGAAGLVALGTTGEPATLRPVERAAVLDVCAGVAGERGVPLIAGAGSNATEASADSLRELARWPQVAAALVTVPYFLRPSQDGVVAHVELLAAASPVPLVVYNVPYRTAVTLSVETVLRLAAIPGVVGTKHSVGAVDEDTVALLAVRPARFAVLGGDDSVISALLAIGAQGGILASAHLRTAEFVALARAWRSGDVERARSLQRALVPLASALFAEPNPSVLKGVLHALGVIASPLVRLPLLPASAPAVAAAQRLVPPNSDNSRQLTAP